MVDGDALFFVEAKILFSTVSSSEIIHGRGQGGGILSPQQERAFD